MSRQPPEAHLAALQDAWPEWQISYRDDPEAAAYMAVLRADPETQLITTHLGALEAMLFGWNEIRIPR